MHFNYSLCLLCSSTLSLLGVLKSFMGDIKWVIREVAIQMSSRSAVIGCYWTLYQLIVDVPTEHLNLFKTNLPLDLNSLSLVAKGTFVV